MARTMHPSFTRAHHAPIWRNTMKTCQCLLIKLLVLTTIPGSARAVTTLRKSGSPEDKRLLVEIGLEIGPYVRLSPLEDQRAGNGIRSEDRRRDPYPICRTRRHLRHRRRRLPLLRLRKRPLPPASRRHAPAAGSTTTRSVPANASATPVPKRTSQSSRRSSGTAA